MYTIGSLYSADVRILINTYELVNGGSASGLDSVGELSPPLIQASVLVLVVKYK